LPRLLTAYPATISTGSASHWPVRASNRKPASSPSPDPAYTRLAAALLPCRVCRARKTSATSSTALNITTVQNAIVTTLITLSRAM
jgi:hypothetical protein